eukprot:6660513-Pyramimonas_sp.AAC.1
MLSTLTRSRSSRRFPAVSRLTVHRRRQFLRGVKLVPIRLEEERKLYESPGVRKVDGLSQAPS